MAEQGGTDPREAQRRLIRRSIEDESFRDELLRDPKAALERELGTSLQENVEVVAVENEPDKIHLVLPPRSLTESSSELSEEELDAVAGGTYIAYTSAGCISNIAYTSAGC
jgi:hypothetical protein